MKLITFDARCMLTEICGVRGDSRQLTIATNAPTVICGENALSNVTYAILELSSTAMQL